MSVSCNFVGKVFDSLVAKLVLGTKIFENLDSLQKMSTSYVTSGGVNVFYFEKIDYNAVCIWFRSCFIKVIFSSVVPTILAETVFMFGFCIVK